MKQNFQPLTQLSRFVTMKIMLYLYGNFCYGCASPNPTLTCFILLLLLDPTCSYVKGQLASFQGGTCHTIWNLL
jgi:hypothetical protein